MVSLVQAPFPAQAESVRCSSRLISPGAEAVELLAACGEPDHLDRRVVIHSKTVGRGEVEQITEEIETWIYAPAGGRMMRLIVLRKGRVESIRSVAVRDTGDDGRCARAIFSAPTTLGQVEFVCGAPVDRTRWIEERIRRTEEGHEIRVVSTRERWVYAPAPGRLIRVFEFENGRLLDESTGARTPE